MLDQVLHWVVWPRQQNERSHSVMSRSIRMEDGQSFPVLSTQNKTSTKLFIVCTKTNQTPQA